MRAKVWCVRSMPKRKTQVSSLTVLSCKNSAKKKKIVVCEPGGWLSPDPKSASTLILDFPTSQTEKEMSAVCKPPRLFLLQEPKWTKTGALTELSL